MKKNLLYILPIFALFSAINSSTKLCSAICSPLIENSEIQKLKEQEQKQKKLEELLKTFTPNFLITTQLPQDTELKKKVRHLFFEPDPDEVKNPFESSLKKDVCTKAIKEYGAQEIMLHTDDDFRISALFFKRQNAPINIIYTTGYFHDQTPTKEWPAPFSLIFPNFNILTFDWRGFGDSEGRRGGKFTPCDFGTNAYPDIQAAIDFFKKENDKPIVLVGFCAGAAMIIKATIEAQKTGKAKADALVLNSIFTDFENQFNRAVIVSENRYLHKLIANLGISKKIIKNTLNGSLFDLKPIDMIEQINIPCYFEHFATDPSAIVEEGIQVFNKTKSFKMFLLSTVGKHVRIHKDAPFQYRNCFYEFLCQSNLLSKDEIEVIKIKDLEDDQKFLKAGQSN